MKWPKINFTLVVLILAIVFVFLSYIFQIVYREELRRWNDELFLAVGISPSLGHLILTITGLSLFGLRWFLARKREKQKQSIQRLY